MKGAIGIAFMVLLGGLALRAATGQDEKQPHQRRPAASAALNASVAPQPQPAYDYFSILDGTPQGLELHHDTEVATGKPVDVYVFPIELQVLNSDGNFEPEGLILDNFYTAEAVDPQTAPNPNNARDCKIWNKLVLDQISHRNPNAPTWSYVEFTVAKGARVLLTNEDGPVWWSDDIECWGSRDRFAPF